MSISRLQKKKTSNKCFSFFTHKCQFEVSNTYSVFPGGRSVLLSWSWMFWWITRELLVSLQYITRVLTLGFLQISYSFTCFKYKVGLIYTLADRIFKITNTTSGREKRSPATIDNATSSPATSQSRSLRGIKTNFHLD